jgi:hypothetical protein
LAGVYPPPRGGEIDGATAACAASVFQFGKGLLQGYREILYNRAAMFGIRYH